MLSRTWQKRLTGKPNLIITHGDFTLPDACTCVPNVPSQPGPQLEDMIIIIMPHMHIMWQLKVYVRSAHPQKTPVGRNRKAGWYHKSPWPAGESTTARYGVEDRLKDSNACKTRFRKKTWNNASSTPEEIRLPHSCASLQNTWKVSYRSFVLITSFPQAYRAHLAIRSESTPILSPLQNNRPNKSATLNSFLPRAIILWNTLPFDVQSSKSLGMFKSKLKTHLSL